jgi:hypothetical protein
VCEDGRIGEDEKITCDLGGDGKMKRGCGRKVDKTEIFAGFGGIYVWGEEMLVGKERGRKFIGMEIDGEEIDGDGNGRRRKFMGMEIHGDGN